jgi:uncharacterized protein
MARHGPEVSMCPTQTARGGPAARGATGPAPPTVTSTPRLLASAYGWWYLGGRQLVLLGPDAVDATGTLDPPVELQLLAAAAHGPTPVRAYSLTALTTTACNLGCGYCFQNTAQDPRGGSQPPRVDSVSMSRQTAREIVDFAAARMADAGLDSLDLHLSGGEPLLNPAGCLDLLEFGRPHGLRSAHLTSNGTLLTPTLAGELAEAGLGSVQVTFDGRREEHDLIRVRRSGGFGTFDAILTRLAKVSAATTLRWELRVNVSERNHAGMDELVDQVAAQLDPASCHLTFHLVDDTGIGYANTLARDTELADRFVRWISHAAESGFRIRPPTSTWPCLSCAIRRGRLGAVVSADGTLYSCRETAGRRGWAVGTTRAGYWPAEVEDRWVGCGHLGRSADSATAVTAFQDAVDGRVLDYLHATGRLGSVRGTPARPADTGQADAGQTDAGQTDAGQTDAGQADAGQVGSCPCR